MNKRILVIDDEQTILDAFLEILGTPDVPSAIQDIEALTAALSGESGAAGPPGETEESYTIETALQGKEGLEKIARGLSEKKPFHLAFIDVRMPPGLDGIETARQIRGLDPFIELVIVTAYSDRTQEEIARTIGYPERLLYLRKPFDREEIRQIALSLTRKWDLEYKHRKHMGYLEELLNSVRRLKVQGVSSVKDVLTAILNELMTIVNAEKGAVFNLNPAEATVEICSENMTQDYLDKLRQTIRNRENIVQEVTTLDDTLILPISNEAGSYLILVCYNMPKADEEKIKLLNLFIETASEVLLSVNQQEQSLKNERIATIGQVAAGIIHEINNPLSSLLSLIQPNGLMKRKLMMIDATSKENQQLVKDISRYLEIASMATNHLTSIVNSMRGMTGTRAMALRNQDVGQALDDALILANNTLSKFGIRVHRQWDSPLMATCDLNGLKQVFLNLILNAAQAMNGKGDLWITATPSPTEMTLSFRDSGPGMTDEVKNSIFNLFYTTKADGTGLGLSIVKGIVENHKGSIRIDSEPGKGATFHITIAVS